MSEPFSEIITERDRVNIRLEPVFWSDDYATLAIWHSDGSAEITRDEANAIAKMLLDWASQG